MAMTVPRGRTRRVARPVDANASAATTASAIPAELAIGDPDTAISTCPACGRPLLSGAGRCPGCGAHLLLGIPARRASVFILLGVVIGMIAGGAVTAAVVRPRAVVDASGSTGDGNAALILMSPGASPSAPAPSTTPAARSSTPPNRPGTAVAALSQTAAVDIRLLASAGVLRAQVAARSTNAVAIADTLRSVSADASLGSALADRMVGWPDAAALRAELQAFYDGVQSKALDALSPSITNAAVYRTSAGKMLVVLGGIAKLDADVQAFAQAQGIELPAAVPAEVTPGGSTAP